MFKIFDPNNEVLKLFGKGDEATGEFVVQVCDSTLFFVTQMIAYAKHIGLLKRVAQGTIFSSSVFCHTTRHKHQLAFTAGRHSEDMPFASIDTDGDFTRCVGVVLTVKRAEPIVATAVDPQAGLVGILSDQSLSRVGNIIAQNEQRDSTIPGRRLTRWCNSRFNSGPRLSAAVS